MDKTLYRNQNFLICIEEHEIPWVKIFTITPYKEISEIPDNLRIELFNIANIVEKEMLVYFKPDKINIASFGNYMPHVHLHVQARFKTDSFFPESTWGEKQRIGEKIQSDDFFNLLSKRLKGILGG